MNYFDPHTTETTETEANASENITVENQTSYTRMPVAGQLAILAVLLLAILSTSAVPQIIATLRGSSDTPAPDIVIASTEPLHTADTEAFNDIALTATAAFVWDVRAQRVLYEKAPDTQLPLASITKLMTALVAYEITTRDTRVAVPDDALAQDGESGFSGGETFTLGALADLTLMTSSNDGAFAIATAAGSLLDATTPTQSFVEAMNIRAQELGLTQTYFRNPTGLDISESDAGAYGSARDIAFLMEHILQQQPEMLEATTESGTTFFNENGAYHAAENTNYIVGSIPGLIGSKTGYTTLAGGNLTVAFDASVNRPVIIVVLGSTYDGRFTDVLALSTAAHEALSE